MGIYVLVYRGGSPEPFDAPSVCLLAADSVYAVFRQKIRWNGRS